MEDIAGKGVRSGKRREVRRFIGLGARKDLRRPLPVFIQGYP